MGAQQAAAPVAVPVEQEPLHHLFLDNATVRVFRVEVPAGGRTLLHQHDRDYLFVTLGDSDVISVRQNEPARQLKLKDGDTAFTKGGFAHVAINADKQKPFRNYTIEIMKAQPDPNPEPPRTLAGAGMSVTWMVDNDRAHAELIELEPGATTPLHEHKRPFLTVALNDATMENDIAGKGKSTTTQKAGDARWTEGGYSHTLKNTGTQPVRWVHIEIK
jgi:quercetin dioxygenase-like cupin family protein